MIVTRVFIMLLVTVLWGNAVATGNTFRHLQAKDGLNDGEVNDIVQDRDGMMWFATWSGLIKYDGYNFQQFRPVIGDSSGLPEKKIKSLFVDSRNNLWVITSRSLSRLVRKDYSFVTYALGSQKTGSSVIHSVHEVDSFLVIHEHHGFYSINLNQLQNNKAGVRGIDIINPEVNYGMDIYSYSKVINNTLYIVANPNNQKSIIYEAGFNPGSDKQTFTLLPVFRFEGILNVMEYVANENTLFLGTDKGILPYSLSDNAIIKSTYYQEKNILNLIYSEHNHVLYGTSDSPEVLYVDLHTGTPDKYIANPYQYGSLINNNIHSLCIDFSGNLWIGHQGQGISILNLNQKEFFTYRQNPFNDNSLTSNKVMCFESNDSHVFVGLRAGGINYFNRNHKNKDSLLFNSVKIRTGGKVTQFRQGVWDIAYLSEDVFLVGTDVGLLELYREGEEWFVKPFSNDEILNRLVNSVFIDDNQNVWCGGFNEGLILIPNLKENPSKKIYQYQKDATNPESISDNMIISMLVDSKGRFWIGTLNGLNLLKTTYNKLDLSGQVKPVLTFKRYIATGKETEYLNNNEINCVYENYDGNIWIATMGGGINILDVHSGAFSNLTVKDGLPSDDILSILTDESGTLWISTINGLVSYNQHAEKAVFRVYNSTDGIQGDIFLVNSYYKAPDGELFFGGDNGFTCFYPKDIKPNMIKPKVTLTNFRLGNVVVHPGDSLFGKVFLQKHMNLTEKIELPYNHKIFSIGAAALHYQYPYGNKIYYFLEGYDKEWKSIPAYYNYIYYSKLPSGKYTLHVRAASSDNQLSDETKTLMIEVKKPWYLTWYMVILFMLVAISLVGGLIYILVNRQKLIFEKQIDRLTIENSESKMTFLTNIAHGLRTPLSLVIAPVDDLMHNYPDIKPEWKSHLTLIQRNAHYLLKLINQIIDFRKLNAGKLGLVKQNNDVISLIKGVIINFRSIEKSNHVKVHLDLPFRSLIVALDSEKIEEVLYNLLSNAFKHTPRNGNIYISLEVIEQVTNEKDPNHHAKITVMNEGYVLPDEQKEKIFERFYKYNDQLEGAGIGLSFSRSLVEMHQGRLVAEPVPERGTAFHMFLPFSSDTIHETVSENNRMVSESDFPVVLPYDNEAPAEDDKKLNIVLIEDNEELKMFLSNFLSREYTCHVAGNGEDGIRLIQRIIPDIIISDIIMPRKDGYDVCREVKSNKNTCHIPVILLTAKNSREEIVSGYEVGADVYVTKPFDLDIIASQIARLIKNRELIRKKYTDQNFMIEVTPQNLSKDDEFIFNIRKILENNLTDPEYNVKSLANSLNISSTQLYRKLKALTGYSPVEFLRVLKLQKAYETLLNADLSVKEVCFASGFNNISYFIKCFKEQFGVTPANLKEKGVISGTGFHNTKHPTIAKLNH